MGNQLWLDLKTKHFRIYKISLKCFSKRKDAISAQNHSESYFPICVYLNSQERNIKKHLMIKFHVRKFLNNLYKIPPIFSHSVIFSQRYTFRWDIQIENKSCISSWVKLLSHVWYDYLYIFSKVLPYTLLPHYQPQQIHNKNKHKNISNHKKK